MRIGGLGMVYPTYVYNPNTVSANSMNKLSRISDNVLDKKVDYSETVAKDNENPLRKGQTLDFEGILAKQMQQGQNRAARILSKGIGPAQEGAGAATTKDAASVQKNAGAASSNDTLSVRENAESVAAGNAKTITSALQNNNTSVMQMQRAIEAYGMSMTA